MLKTLAILAALLAALPAIGSRRTQEQKAEAANPRAVTVQPHCQPVATNINITNTETKDNADQHQCEPQEKPRSTRPPWTEPFWSNWALVLVGVLGAIAAIWAGVIAYRNLRVSLRPRLIVRRIHLIRGTSKQDGADPWSVQIVVANTGGSRATITRSNLTIDHDRSGIFEHAPKFSTAFDSMGTPTLEAGQSEPLLVALSHDAAGWQRITELIDSEGREQKGWLYCLGFIEYRDTLGIVRSTGFLRKYVVETKRFVLIGDPDYEYAD